MYIHSLETWYTSNFGFVSFTKLAMYTPIISRMLDSCDQKGGQPIATAMLLKYGGQ